MSVVQTRDSSKSLSKLRIFNKTLISLEETTSFNGNRYQRSKELDSYGTVTKTTPTKQPLVSITFNDGKNRKNRRSHNAETCNNDSYDQVHPGSCEPENVSQLDDNYDQQLTNRSNVNQQTDLTEINSVQPPQRLESELDNPPDYVSNIHELESPELSQDEFQQDADKHAALTKVTANRVNPKQIRWEEVSSSTQLQQSSLINLDPHINRFIHDRAPTPHPGTVPLNHVRSLIIDERRKEAIAHKTKSWNNSNS